MKPLLFILSILTANSIFAQTFPLKNIYKIDVSHPWENREDSVLYYTITTIDSIIPNGDTIFKMEYSAEGWQFMYDTLYKHRQYKYQNGGYIMNGKKEGLWDITHIVPLFEEGTIRHELAYYYRNEFISHWYDDPLRPAKECSFLDDTIFFCVGGFQKDYVLKKYSADTMYFKITANNCFFYIDNVLVDSIKLRDLNSTFKYDICGGWNTRKYRILLDSLKNVNDN